MLKNQKCQSQAISKQYEVFFLEVTIKELP